ARRGRLLVSATEQDQRLLRASGAPEVEPAHDEGVGLGPLHLSDGRAQRSDDGEGEGDGAQENAHFDAPHSEGIPIPNGSMFGRAGEKGASCRARARGRCRDRTGRSSGGGTTASDGVAGSAAGVGAGAEGRAPSVVGPAVARGGATGTGRFEPAGRGR